MRELRPLLVPDSAGGNPRYCRHHGSGVCRARPLRNGHGPAAAGSTAAASGCRRDGRICSRTRCTDASRRWRCGWWCGRRAAAAGPSVINARTRRSERRRASSSTVTRSVVVPRPARCRGWSGCARSTGTRYGPWCSGRSCGRTSSRRADSRWCHWFTWGGAGRPTSSDAEHAPRCQRCSGCAHSGAIFAPTRRSGRAQCCADAATIDDGRGRRTGYGRRARRHAAIDDGTGRREVGWRCCDLLASRRSWCARRTAITAIGHGRCWWARTSRGARRHAAVDDGSGRGESRRRCRDLLE